jgi:hypothetical protein
MALKTTLIYKLKDKHEGIGMTDTRPFSLSYADRGAVADEPFRQVMMKLSVLKISGKGCEESAKPCC